MGPVTRAAEAAALVEAEFRQMGRPALPMDGPARTIPRHFVENQSASRCDLRLQADARVRGLAGVGEEEDDGVWPISRYYRIP
jgi:hypothetical protein